MIPLLVSDQLQLIQYGMEACYTKSGHHLVLEGIQMLRLAIEFAKIMSYKLERDSLGGMLPINIIILCYPKQPPEENNHG